ncbi:hypothetical protein NQ317_002688 [Molorchus minor]|uniref:Uncharacterized protein n=1 Tax=Molorchus minor TaxID=1323400 RepID=A0ABQ9JWD1_9CUCU|nr:hypothetical protein NQ317_002688 [Molorchus minor]
MVEYSAHSGTREAALIIFPSSPIKNTEDGMKRWLRRAKKRVNRTYESKEQLFLAIDIFALC